MDTDVAQAIRSMQHQIDLLAGKLGSHGLSHEIAGNDTVRLHVRDDGTDTTGRQRTLNFLAPITVNEDTTNQEYEIGLSTAALDFGEAGDITSIDTGDSAAAGSTGEVADAGHQHAIGTILSDHTGAADPHSVYVLEAATPGGELGSTYATPTVDTTHSGSSHAAVPTQTALLAAGAGLTVSGADLTITARRFHQAKGANLTAANDFTLGTDGNVFIVTGATTINAITTTGWQAGATVVLIFGDAVTVKHDTAGGAGTAVIRLNGAVDFSVSANDVLSLVFDGSTWWETGRSLT